MVCGAAHFGSTQCIEVDVTIDGGVCDGYTRTGVGQCAPPDVTENDIANRQFALATSAGTQISLAFCNSEKSFYDGLCVNLGGSKAKDVCGSQNATFCSQQSATLLAPQCKTDADCPFDETKVSEELPCCSALTELVKELCDRTTPDKIEAYVSLHPDSLLSGNCQQMMCLAKNCASASRS